MSSTTDVTINLRIGVSKYLKTLKYLEPFKVLRKQILSDNFAVEQSFFILAKIVKVYFHLSNKSTFESYTSPHSTSVFDSYVMVETCG